MNNNSIKKLSGLVNEVADIDKKIASIDEILIAAMDGCDTSIQVRVKKPNTIEDKKESIIDSDGSLIIPGDKKEISTLFGSFTVSNPEPPEFKVLKHRYRVDEKTLLQVMGDVRVKFEERRKAIMRKIKSIQK